MKGSKALSVTLLLTAGLVALAIALRGPYARLAAEHWRRELATVSDRRADQLLRQVADLGDAGIPILVEALGAERESVAKAAGEVLSEQLNRWQNLYPANGLQKQAILADALAGAVEQFRPAARGQAAELAARILLWLPEAAAADRSPIIAACEKVVRRGAADRRWPAEEESAGSVASGLTPQRELPLPLADGAGESSQARDPWQAAEMPVAELARLPGGGLPIDSFPAAALRLPAAAVDSPPLSGGSGDVSVVQPQRLDSPTGARPLSSLRRPRSGSASGANSSSGKSAAGSSPQGAAGVTPLSGAETAAGTGEGPDSRPDAELGAAETTAVMRMLHAADKSRAARARAELMRRGFSEVHLDLARRLFDPDLEVRKELARALPGLRSVDAIPWMLWLSHDEDPEVRLVAVTLMATTGDPALCKQIEKMAQEDPDPRIQERADRLSQQRSPTRH
jgi:hypothetical protein